MVGWSKLGWSVSGSVHIRC